jgi:hypothetical protein
MITPERPVTVVSPAVTFLPKQAVPNSLTTAELGVKLVEYFGNSGAKPVEISTKTIPAVIAACPFRHDICKLARVNVFVNVDYEKAVLRRREKCGIEGEWEAKERKNGLDPVEGTPFLKHPGTGILYLRCLHPKSHGYEYWTLDGTRQYDTDEVNRWLRKSSNRQGLSEKDEVRERDYTLTNIVAVTINGVAYLVTHKAR